MMSSALWGWLEWVSSRAKMATVSSSRAGMATMSRSHSGDGYGELQSGMAPVQMKRE